MKESRSALRYAKALLNLAINNKSEEEVNNNMKMIVETIAESNDLAAMLKSPVIKASDKKKVLIALFQDKSSTIVKGLFNLLEENKRMMMLDSIAKQYTIIYNHHKSLQVARVTTAVPLTKELEEKIQSKIVALTGNSATIKNIVNPEIIGGFILQVGDKQYDASISNRFNSLRKEFDNSHYISKI